MCRKPQWSANNVLVIQSLFPEDGVDGAGCVRNIMLCCCPDCLDAKDPMTSGGRLSEFLDRCFMQDAEEAVQGGFKPPVNLMSEPALDPRPRRTKPTKKHAREVIAAIGADTISSEIVAAYG